MGAPDFYSTYAPAGSHRRAHDLYHQTGRMASQSSLRARGFTMTGRQEQQPAALDFGPDVPMDAIHAHLAAGATAADCPFLASAEAAGLDMEKIAGIIAQVLADERARTAAEEQQ
jgi:hypothetical protein